MLDIIWISFWLIQNNNVNCFNYNTFFIRNRKKCIKNYNWFQLLFIGKQCLHLCLAMFIGCNWLNYKSYNFFDGGLLWGC